MPEFDIIQRYFNQKSTLNNTVRLGIGDDAAVLTVPPECDMVVAVDTLVKGVHFPVDTSAFDIGYKALAVNLSDLAAMGAIPRWMTLALTLPQADEAWLADFSSGLFSLAKQYDVSLVGGDTTQGPLTISIQVGGIVQKDRVLLRSGARPGDFILVSGSLGDAGRAVQLLQQQALNVPPAYLARLNQPTPRLQLGQALIGLANACIDISDGLYADLSHITEASHVGAVVEIEQLPLSTTLRQDDLEDEEKYRLALGGGDDYELCFTVSEDKLDELEQKLSLVEVEYTVIGRINSGTDVQLHSTGGREIVFDGLGYQHFT